MRHTDSKASLYQADHRRFGGLIYPSDFYTDYRGKDHAGDSMIARRITYDAKFDNQCRINQKNRQNYRRDENA